jgi:hypothetical protein
MSWETTGAVPTVTRAEAETKIKALAVAQGIDGTFKVFYNGAMISTPSQLPEAVDMSKVRVSEVMNQAACAKKPAKKVAKKLKK